MSDRLKLTDEEDQLARKLADAGPTEDEAREWVREIIMARLAPYRVTVKQVIPLPHHVVLRNGREDIVCACGEHFRSTLSPNGMSGEDAIKQWVAHYRTEEKGQ